MGNLIDIILICLRDYYAIYMRTVSELYQNDPIQIIVM